MMRIGLAPLLVALALLSVGAGSHGNASSVDSHVLEPKAPAANLAFTLTDVAGKSVRLADYKGKLVVLNFWATWCIPCRAEIPALVALQSKYGAKGLQMIGVSIDDPIEK